MKIDDNTTIGDLKYAYYDHIEDLANKVMRHKHHCHIHIVEAADASPWVATDYLCRVVILVSDNNDYLQKIHSRGDGEPYYKTCAVHAIIEDISEAVEELEASMSE